MRRVSNALMPTILQKRAIRVIVGYTYRASAVSRFEELNMMKFESRNKYQIGIFVYKYVNGKLPIGFKDFFVRVEDSHGYLTRATGGMVRQ